MFATEEAIWQGGKELRGAAIISEPILHLARQGSSSTAYLSPVGPLINPVFIALSAGTFQTIRGLMEIGHGCLFPLGRVPGRLSFE
jgi:hypothetical protein